MRNALPYRIVVGTLGAVTPSDLRDAAAARRYDDPTSHMFTPEVLGPSLSTSNGRRARAGALTAAPSVGWAAHRGVL